jgi:thioester reductase-like protein
MNLDHATIWDPIRANALTHPDKLLYAFLDVDGRIRESHRYESFVERTTDIAWHIRRNHSLKPGERVLLVYPPGLEMICAFFACVRLGLIPVPVYPPSSHGFAAALYRMNFIAQDCRATAVMTDRPYYWSMKLHRTRTSIARLSFKRDYTSRLEWIVTSDAQANAPDHLPEARSDVLFLQYTSGSTSEPKGVIVTHDNVLSSCRMILDHRPNAVSWLPQYHDLGLIAFYLFVAIRGGTNYGFAPIDFIRRPFLWLETMSRYGATASAAPNFAFEYCLRPGKLDDRWLEGSDFSTLQLLWSGAEPVRANVFQDFFDKLAPYGLPARAYSGSYGLAEYTLAVSGRGSTVADFDGTRIQENAVASPDSGAPPDEVVTLVSCGKPLGETEVRIADLSGTPREAPAGRIGEIWLDGPSKCPGYWGRPELSRQTFEAQLEGDAEGRWLRTGDLGFLQDGELFVCGRTKDLIIVRGLNYYPQDIEAIVEEDPAVRKGCVAAFAVEQDGGEAVFVVAEVKNAKRLPDSADISRSVRQKLGLAVDSFVYISARTIPKTSSGKIARHRAREAWREGCLEVLGRVEPANLSVGTFEAVGTGVEVVGDAARQWVDDPSFGAVLRKYGLTGTEHMTVDEAGLDSLALAELAVGLESHLEACGASDLVAAVDIRWLQNMAISELFELLHQVSTAAPYAKLHFRQAFHSLRREKLDTERQLMDEDARSGVDFAWAPRVNPGVDSRPGGILLTGGTGFLGPFLIRSLLQQCDDDVYVLVRATSPDHGMARLREGIDLLGAPLIATLPGGWERRVIPICGDLSQARLGVSASHWSFLSETVHTIYHNGALVNYLLDYASMRATNVGGTNEVIRLAVSRRPKVLNHVSTTFVFGWSTQDTLPETESNRDMRLLDFGYSQSKWVSEQIVLSAKHEGLRTRVFRPALIAPSTGGGGYNFDITIRLLAFMLKHGISTTAGNQVSFSPADVVANNIVAISNLPDSAGQTFHVTRDAYSSMVEITDILGARTGRRFDNLALADFVPTVIERCQPDDLLFPLLNFLVRSVDNITAMEFKRYDNRSYREARERSPWGREDPPLEDVVGGIVRFMRRWDLIESPRAERVLERA